MLAEGTVTIHNDQLKQVNVMLFAVEPDGDFESTVGIMILALVVLSGWTLSLRLACDINSSCICL